MWRHICRISEASNKSVLSYQIVYYRESTVQVYTKLNSPLAAVFFTSSPDWLGIALAHLTIDTVAEYIILAIFIYRRKCTYKDCVLYYYFCCDITVFFCVDHACITLRSQLLETCRGWDLLNFLHACVVLLKVPCYEWRNFSTNEAI